MTRPRSTVRNRHRIVRASAATARAVASWVAAIEPWRGLGYQPGPLGRYLARMAGEGNVWVAARPGRSRGVAAVAVATDGFLLGGFISLLAVRPDANGQGLGRALIDHIEARAAAKRRWLFVSCDAGNAAALRFYRRLGFARVGRLPDLVAPGRVELLLRKRVGSTMRPAE
jgi:ribosomal protein S18 acetylase RimI-like enzyme